MIKYEVTGPEMSAWVLDSYLNAMESGWYQVAVQVQGGEYGDTNRFAVDRGDGEVARCWEVTWPSVFCGAGAVVVPIGSSGQASEGALSTVQHAFVQMIYLRRGERLRWKGVLYWAHFVGSVPPSEVSVMVAFNSGN